MFQIWGIYEPGISYMFLHQNVSIEMLIINLDMYNYKFLLNFSKLTASEELAMVASSVFIFYFLKLLSPIV